MAGIDQIPLPQQQYPFADLANYWNNLKKQGFDQQLQSGQLDLQNRQLAETSKYHEGELGIQRMAQARAQQILPYLIQQYKDIHGQRASQADIDKIQHDLYIDAYNKQKQELAAQAQGGVGDIPNMPQGGQFAQPAKTPVMYSPENIKRLQDLAASGQSAPQDTQMINQFLGVNKQSPLSVVAPTGNAMQPSQMSPEMNAGVMGMGPRQAGLPPQPQMPPAMSNAQPQGMPAQQPAGAPQAPASSSGGQVVLQQGDPSKYWMDKLAMSGNPNVPASSKPQFKPEKDGVYTYYPASGKITFTPNPLAKGSQAEAPDEKEQHAVSTALKIEAGKEKMKEAKEIEGASDDAIQVMQAAANMKSLLRDNPRLTGLDVSIEKALGSGSKSLGSFNENAITLQGEAAKRLSTRGGYGVAKIVSGAKPDIKNNSNYNIGALNNYITRGVDSFIKLKEKYEKTHPGDSFPYDADKVFGKLEVEAPDGKVLLLPASGAIQLIQDHPDHKVIG